MEKRSFLNRITVTVTALAMSFGAYAIPARPGVQSFTRPDGSSIEVLLKGDEHFHYYTTTDGYLLLEQDNDLYYATSLGDVVINSGRKATDIELRSAADRSFLASQDALAVIDSYVAASAAAERPTRSAARVARASSPAKAKGLGLFPGASFPAYGTQKGLVVLVEYKDVKFNLSNPADFFNRMLNQSNFSDYGGTGSARDYFIASSDGQFTPQFDVYGPITLRNNRSYYGSNDSYGNDLHADEMAIEACQQLDASVDFTQYDRDGDGLIDYIYVFYAGIGENGGGGTATVWPHSWDVTESKPYNSYNFDGVRLTKYACSNEWYKGKPDGIGTFCHEFGHVLGIPDFYATNGSGAFTPDTWDIMDMGSYNNDTHTPPLYSAFERYALGWNDPIKIDGPMTGSLPPLSDVNKAYVINTPAQTEYYILENRQLKGWDRYLPGHGMLVWHIDYNEQIWTDNECNNNNAHQYIDLVEADNQKTKTTRAGDAFPGTSGVTSFTDNTTPSMRTWKSFALDLPITNITETGGNISFVVKGGAPSIVTPVIDPNPVDVTTTSFTAKWSSAGAGCNYYVTLVRGRVTLVNSLNIGNKTQYTFTDLNPGSSYVLRVKASDGTNMTGNSADVTFTTLTEGFDSQKPSLMQATEIKSDGFTMNWSALSGATGYYINVVGADGTTTLYNDYYVGNVASYVVTGLEPETTYNFTVQATNGSTRSLKSDVATITTEVGTGIETVASGTNISVNGLNIEVKTDDVENLVIITDIAGRVVATRTLSAESETFTLPAPGLYFVRTNGAITKLLVK